MQGKEYIGNGETLEWQIHVGKYREEINIETHCFCHVVERPNDTNDIIRCYDMTASEIQEWIDESIKEAKAGFSERESAC